MEQIKPTVLISLDGWGIDQPSRGNCITSANTPVFDDLITRYPVMSLQSSGEAVGLMWGEMGNSEVGHLSMGTGHIVYQSLPRINKSITSGDFFKRDALLQLKKFIIKNNSTLHLLGLVSDGGVHSHIDHLFALLDFCKENTITKVCVHVILDGRDTKQDGGLEYVKSLKKKLSEIGFGQIATVSGRYYPMDRDQRWDRIELAYLAMTQGKSLNSFSDPIQAIEKSYEEGVYDEEFKPAVIKKNDVPVGLVEDKDALVFFNFRSDRARQLTSAFVLPGFEKFSRKKYFANMFFCSFTNYDKDLPVDAVVFPPEHIENPLAKVISDNNMKQLHIAETEKYAHVTYFFNGGKEDPFPGEDRILVPSPPVANYAEKPEMSAVEITEKVVKAVSENKYNFIIINFANADMVGHTGDIEATKKAVEVADACMGRIVKTVLEKDGNVVITADHGNAESLIRPMTGEIEKEHTSNPVPCVIVGYTFEGKASGFGTEAVGTDLSILKPSGMLVDISPTILKLMGLTIPKEMQGTPLI